MRWGWGGSREADQSSAHSLIQTFSPFGLAPTGYHPGYQTVQACERNDIELFGNLGPAGDEKLRVAGEPRV
jgi:hypothetical protein